MQAQRARWIEQRKEEKRTRKARGLRNASEGGSCASTSSEETGPRTPPSEGSHPAAKAAVPAPADAPVLALRKVVRKPPAMLDSRIRGADLYVVRLLQDTQSKAKIKNQRRRHRGLPLRAAPAASAAPRFADSRPCWRCLEWMYWAGIKRVFWTDPDGMWHGDKVEHLLFGASDAGVYVPVHLTQYERAALQRRSRAAGMPPAAACHAGVG